MIGVLFTARYSAVGFHWAPLTKALCDWPVIGTREFRAGSELVAASVKFSREFPVNVQLEEVFVGKAVVFTVVSAF